MSRHGGRGECVLVRIDDRRSRGGFDSSELGTDGVGRRYVPDADAGRKKQNANLPGLLRLRAALVARFLREHEKLVEDLLG